MYLSGDAEDTSSGLSDMQNRPGTNYKPVDIQLTHLTQYKINRFIDAEHCFEGVLMWASAMVPLPAVHMNA